MYTLPSNKLANLLVTNWPHSLNISMGRIVTQLQYQVVC